MRKVTYWFCVMTIMVMVGYYVRVDQSSGTTLGRIAAIPTLVSWFLYKLEVRRAREWGSVMLSILVFFAYAMLSYIWSVSPEDSQYGIQRMLVNLVLVSVIWDLSVTPKEAQGLMQAFVGALYVSFFTLLKDVYSGVGWYADRFNAEGVDSNETAFSVMLALPIAWFFAISKDVQMNKFLRYVNLFFPIVALLTLIFTASRGGLAVGLPVFIWIIATSNKAPRWVPYTISFGGIGLVIAVALGAFQKQILRLGTLFSSTVNEGAGGRFELAFMGLDIFGKNPWVGTGINTDAYMSMRYPVDHRAGMGIPVHNLYIQILATLGFVGLLLFLWVMVTVINTAKKVPRAFKVPLYMALYVYFVGNMALPFTIKPVNWMFLVIFTSYAVSVAAMARKPSAKTAPAATPAFAA